MKTMGSKVLANSQVEVNGFKINMHTDTVTEKIRLIMKHVASKSTIEDQTFNSSDPADVSAVFAKFSNCITWAVTSNMNEQQTSGM